MADLKSVSSSHVGVKSMAVSWRSLCAATVLWAVQSASSADSQCRPGSSSEQCADTLTAPEQCPQPLPEYPNLPFRGYQQQGWFHQIDTSWPGLQLIHEEPYLFIVNDFLSPEDCDQLIAKASSNLRGDSFNTRGVDGDQRPGARTSMRSITTDAEVAPLRQKIARLAKLEVSQLQHLKLSRYRPGEKIDRHIDAQPGALPRELSELIDGNNDGGRARHGVVGDNRPGMNRFATVLVYLNNVEKGGRTRFRWTCYDLTEPKIRPTCREFYDRPTASHGRSPRNGTPNTTVVSVVAKRGMALIHFPSTTAATGGISDFNTLHEGEAPGDGEVKYVVQSFTWSLPNGNMTALLGRNDFPPAQALTNSVV